MRDEWFNAQVGRGVPEQSERHITAKIILDFDYFSSRYEIR